MNSDPQTPQTTAVTRRRAVGVAGAAGAALLLAKVSGPDRLLGSIGIGRGGAGGRRRSCVLIPAKTEGPYFVDEKLNRSDIRTDPGDGTTAGRRPAEPHDGRRAAPTPAARRSQGAVVDIWHANAAGKYSDIASEGTSGKKFLRGLQATDASGQANFTTIFPGWYSGRAVHIHFKVRVFSGSTTTYEFNSQLFFDPGDGERDLRREPLQLARHAERRQRRRQHLRQRRGEAARRAVGERQRRLRRHVRRRPVGPAEHGRRDRDRHRRRDGEQRRRRAQRDEVPPHGDQPPHPARHLDGRRDRQGQGAPVAQRRDDRDEDRDRRDGRACARSTCRSRARRPAARRG